MEVLLPMLEFLGKAFLKQDCTNPPMLALHGHSDPLSWWILNAWQQMEAMCLKAGSLTLFTPRISGKAGHLVIHPGTARLVAASSLTR
jgi:hypothetical protein